MNTADRWKNRRKMAWICLWAGVSFPAWLLMAMLIGDVSPLVSIATPYLVFIGSVVGAYIGFATVDDKWHPDGERDAGR